MTLRLTIIALLLTTLTAGALTPQEMVMGAAYRVRGAAVSAWTPASLSPSAWYDSNDTTYLTITPSNTVSAWADKSGNGRTLTQTTGSRQPSVTNNALWFTAARSTCLFTTNTFLTAATTNASGIAIFYVAKYGNGSAEMTPWCESLTSQNAISFRSSEGTTGNLRTLLAHTAATILGASYSDNNIINSSNNFVSRQYVYSNTPTNMTSTNAVNGSIVLSVVNKAYSPSDLFTYTRDRFTIGAWIRSSIVGPKDGPISEWIAFIPAPSPTDQQKVEGWLAWRYGANTYLPTNHPYYGAAP